MDPEVHVIWFANKKIFMWEKIIINLSGINICWICLGGVLNKSNCKGTGEICIICHSVGLGMSKEETVM